MVGKIDVLHVSLEKTSSRTSSPKTGEMSFMDVLKQEFDQVTSKLQDVPGMPGVYVVNQPQQTLDSLNISSVI
jgi:flagellar hook-basal body complex protein FliE